MKPKMESYLNQRECRAMRYDRPTESTLAKTIERRSSFGGHSKGTRTRSGSRSVSKTRAINSNTTGDVFNSTKHRKGAVSKRTRMSSVRVYDQSNLGIRVLTILQYFSPEKQTRCHMIYNIR